MIKKAKELDFTNKKITMIIAGVPGIGKTTLALSSPNPLLIDLDGGISRVEARFRKDTDVVNSYDELVSDLKESNLKDYETIVIDTGGKLLEFLKPVVIAEDPKAGKRDGGLTLQGYGAVKRKFADFIQMIKPLNKHLIFIFHATEISLGQDITGLRVRIEGSTKDEVWDDVDIGGFIEMKGQKRTIGFSNCERYYAKGTHGISGLYDIPKLDAKTENTFIADLFKQINENLSKETEELGLYENVMLLKKELNECKNTEEINAIYEKIKNAEHHLTSKEELWFAISVKAKEIGVKYDKEKNLFE